MRISDWSSDVCSSDLISPALQRPLNVTDFATPVQRIDASASGAGSQIVLSTDGPFETMAYQTGRDYIVEIVPRAAAPPRAVGAPQSGAGTVPDPRGPHIGRASCRGSVCRSGQ